MLNGIFPVLCTPFNADEDVDESSLRCLIDYVLRAKVSGVVAGGVASEVFKLSDAERYQITRVTIEQVAGRVPVIVGTWHDSARIAVRLAEEAQVLGAAAVMVMPPIATRPSLGSVAEYYAAIGSAIEIPVMIQDAPMVSGISMPVPFILDLMKQTRTLSMIKVEAPPTGPKVSALLDGAGRNISVFGGLGGNNILDELERGAIGSLPGSAFPSVLVRVYECHIAGAHAEAQEIYNRHVPLLRFVGQSIDWSHHGYKQILWRRGVIRTPVVRRPTVTFDQRAAGTLAALLGASSSVEAGPL